MTLTPPPLKNDCFALPAGQDWTPVPQIHQLLQQRLTPIAQVKSMPAIDALGYVLSEPVLARRDNPPHANSAVDGYGLCAELYGEGSHVVSCVKGRSAAGAPYLHDVPKHKAIRILTGASVPAGVDTIVLQEDVATDGDKIAFNGPLKVGSNLRKAGEDAKATAEILPAGRRITPTDLALVAATGVQSVRVYQPLRVGVLSTGDELAEAGSEADEHQIYDANRPMLLAMIARFGHVAVDLGVASDERNAVQTMLESASSEVDVILTSGGASAGDEDHVSALLQDQGRLVQWRIAMKPGRPMALALWNGTPVFGLPGNPVAAFVCGLVFAKPALDLLAGKGWGWPEGRLVPASFVKRKKPGRHEYLRARIREGRAEVFASEGSGRVSGLSWAEGLVELPFEEAEVSEGSLVRYYAYEDFGL